MPCIGVNQAFFAAKFFTGCLKCKFPTTPLVCPLAGWLWLVGRLISLTGSYTSLLLFERWFDIITCGCNNFKMDTLIAIHHTGNKMQQIFDPCYLWDNKTKNHAMHINSLSHVISSHGWCCKIFSLSWEQNPKSNQPDVSSVWGELINSASGCLDYGLCAPVFHASH